MVTGIRIPNSSQNDESSGALRRLAARLWYCAALLPRGRSTFGARARENPPAGERVAIR
jgi:hypothetical protein